MEWPARRVRMTKRTGMKRQRSPRRVQDNSDGDDGTCWAVQERRTKHREDLQPVSTQKGKGKVQDLRPTSTARMRQLQVQQEFR